MRSLRRAVTIIAAAGAMLVPGVSPGAEVDVRSTTIFGGRPSVVDGKVSTVVPLTEVVGLSARRIENPVFQDLSVAVDAWGSYEFSNGPEGNNLASDVNIAQIEGKLLDRRLRLRLGRQIVHGGVARASFIDGLGVEYRSAFAVGVQVYAGVPVEKRFSNWPKSDFATGARVFWAPSFNTELGASFTWMRQDHVVAREDVGVDGRARLHKTVTLNGSASFALTEQRLIEAVVGPRWTPIPAVEVYADYRHQSPDLLLPRNSILSVFASTQRDDAGLSVLYAAGPLGLYAEGRKLWLPFGDGYDAGARATYRFDAAGRTMLTAQARRLLIPDNGYLQGRLAARKTFGELALSADLESYLLDKAVRGQTTSFSVAVNGTWKFHPSWQAGLTLFGATTPTFETRYEAIAKLVYTFAKEEAREASEAKKAE